MIVKEDIKKIQEIVGVKVDGIYGDNTKSAIMSWQKRYGLVADGIVGNKTMQAIIEFQKRTCFIGKCNVAPKINLLKFNYTLRNISHVMKNKGYQFYDNDNQLNIIAIRNNLNDNRVTNIFDDWITISYKESGKWYMYHFPMTTDAGKRAMFEVKNSNGVAMLVPNQYVDAYAIGLHKGQYKALRQVKNVSVYRDRNKDLIYDKTNIDTGLFGINIHRSSPTGTSTYVENWSEGCQVFANIDNFNTFMSLCEKHKELYGNKFTYTLLESNDFKRFKFKNLI